MTHTFHRNFMRHVEQDHTTGCWMWTGARLAGGYGIFQMEKTVTAHRAAWTLFVRPIEDGLVIDHECHNEAARQGLCPGGVACLHRRCVNPDHLRVVTRKQNSNNSIHIKTGPTTGPCPAGHPYPESFTIRPNGKRLCRLCNAARVRAFNARKKAA